MESLMKKPELLAPAGNFEKLEIAIHYGADAVYLAGKDFSLRNFSGNFSDESLGKAVDFAHEHNVKVYLACNIYARNNQQTELEEFLKKVAKWQPDALIVSDPGIIFLARQMVPEMDIHLSTQSNTTNINTVRFWQEMGIARVNLARELSLEEIREIALNTDVEVEAFVHGSMCISYSGRCLLSNFLSGRGANQGLCSHPCRWKYHLVEEQRPNEFYPIAEDDAGTYIMNSMDLCMIEHIPELVRAGISSLKIEGRMKGISYLSSVVSAYRSAIDAFVADPENYQVNPDWVQELEHTYHRPFATGFYFENRGDNSSVVNQDNLLRGNIHHFIGKILGKIDDNRYLVEIKNKISRGDTVSVLTSRNQICTSKLASLTDEKDTPIEFTKPNTCAVLELGQGFSPNDMVRKL